MRKHIREQIEFRIQRMKPECYIEGACTICGCETIKLQMAYKTCEGHCYPILMGAGDWKHFKQMYLNKRVMQAVYPYQNVHVENTFELNSD